MIWRCVFACICVATIPEFAYCGSICPLPWNEDTTLKNNINKSKECPWGRATLGQVTIPNDANWLDYICVVYGYALFIPLVGTLCGLLVRTVRYRGIPTRGASFLLFAAFISFVNEFIFKPLLKQPRPDHSCNHSCGFPSGHSAFSVGFFFLAFLDGLFRVRPKMPLSPDAAKRHVRKLGGTQPKLRHMWIKLELSPFQLMPLSVDDTVDAFEFFLTLCYWACMMLPVPFSRVYLQDHTTGQVFVGGTVGMIAALIWHFLMHGFLLPNFNRLLGTHVGFVFFHTYALPRFKVYSRCLCQLAEYEREDEAVHTNMASRISDGGVKSAPFLPIVMNPKRTQELEDMKRELEWYVKRPHSIDLFPEDKLHHESELEEFQLLLNRVHSELDRSNQPQRTSGVPNSRVELTQQSSYYGTSSNR